MSLHSFFIPPPLLPPVVHLLDAARYVAEDLGVLAGRNKKMLKEVSFLSSVLPFDASDKPPPRSTFAHATSPPFFPTTQIMRGCYLASFSPDVGTGRGFAAGESSEINSSKS